MVMMIMMMIITVTYFLIGVELGSNMTDIFLGLKIAVRSTRGYNCKDTIVRIQL
jgi:hypothetical protein